MNRSPGSGRTRRQQKTANRLGLLVVLIMVFSGLFSTIGTISPVAAAQPTEDDCIALGQVLDETTGECVDDVSEDSVDQASDDGTTDGEEPSVEFCEAQGQDYDESIGECVDPAEDGTDYQPEDEVFATLDVYKYECPSDFDADSGGLDYFSSTCTEAMQDVSFQLSGGNGSGGSGSTDGSGYVGFTDLESGSYSLSESVPEGYGTPYVWCAFGDAESSTGGYSSYDTSGGSSISIDFESYAYGVCYWYNIPEYNYGITIYKYFCDSSEPVLSGSEWDFDDYQQFCTGSPDQYDVAFEMNDSSGVPSSQAVGSVIPGGVYFDEYEPGSISFTELPTEGYGSAVVYCGFQSPEAGGSFSTEEVPVTDLTISVSVGAEEQYTCYWFNLPDYGGITIIKYFCPEGYVATEPTFSNLSEECTDYHDGVPFDVSSSTGYSETGETGDDSPGTVIFEAEDEGSYTITETIPEGYGIPYVTCFENRLTTDMSDSLISEAALETAQEDGSYTVNYPGQPGLTCYWFNIPTDDYSIDIYKWECPSGYDAASAAYNDLVSECSVAKDDVVFTIEQDGGTSETGTTGDDGPGLVSFSGYTGGVTISEDVPDGYGTPIVYCGPETDNPTYASEAENYPVDESSGFTLEGVGEAHWICYVFNTPSDPGIVIHKYYCPEGYTSDESTNLQTFQESCSTPQENVQYDVISNGSNVGTGTTDAEGNVEFSGLAAGEYRIEETLPNGYSVLAVYCSTQGDPGSYDVQEGYWINAQLAEPSDPGYLECWWFNYPDDHDVTIYKFYCESGYAPETMEYSTYLENCTETRDGGVFTVGDQTKTVGPDSPSGAANSLVYDDVPNGELAVSETVPDGYGTPIVYCWLVPTTDTTSAYLSEAPTSYQADESGRILVDYDEGYRLICYVFNIPDDHDIVIYKYICPYGYDYEGASHEELIENCEVVEVPIPFSIASGTESLETQNTGDVIEGAVAFDGYASGSYTVTEDIPEGYEQPRTFCRVLTTSTEPILYASAEPTEMDVTDGAVLLDPGIGASAEVDYSWYCDWFNFEASSNTNTVTIHKWECPVFGEGVVIEETQNWLLENCTTSMEGVTFNLDDLAGPRSLDTGGDGIVTFDDVNNGPVTVTETIPTGYGQPSVFCGWTAFYNGAVYDAFPQKVDAPDGVWTTSVDIPNSEYYCDWFNYPDQPGDITIYKYWCEEGYDLYAYGSDPYADCTDKGEDIEFSLDDSSKTTDSEGTVFWGDLDPGDYTVTETYPSGTDYSFVLNCYGGRFAGIQPYPLQFEPSLSVKLVAGDHIYCYWYNVPERNDGWITVYKYWCSTKTYKTEVDCEIYENGQKFELYTYPGDDKVDEKTTTEYGELTFGGLESGTYALKEPDRKWCAIDISDKGDNDSVKVTSGKETVVKVYNCAPDKDDPKDPGDPGGKKPNPKKPTKYPNTGVDPTAITLPSTGVGPFEGGGMNSMILLAVFAALSLAAGGYVLRRRPNDNFRPVAESPDATGSLTTRRTIIGAALGAVSLPLIAVAQDGDDNDRVPDDEASPEASPGGTPDVPQCRDDATPDASDPDEDPDCIRGEVPKHIAIEAIGVDADIEIQEIVAGELQDPTGPTLVTWYKETTRLGERGNGVYAGHLNYWGVPEGVFFAIKTLQPGDEIVFTGENDETFTYAVEWVQNQPGQDQPDPAVLGLTEEESITLITCGGEWDTTIAEYNERTAVRAVRQKAKPA